MLSLTTLYLIYEHFQLAHIRHPADLTEKIHKLPASSLEGVNFVTFVSPTSLPCCRCLCCGSQGHLNYLSDAK